MIFWRMVRKLFSLLRKMISRMPITGVIQLAIQAVLFHTLGKDMEARKVVTSFGELLRMLSKAHINSGTATRNKPESIQKVRYAFTLSHSILRSCIML